MSINTQTALIYNYSVGKTTLMQGNFDFMKSGQDSVIAEENISNEDIASVAAPFVVYMQKALEVCDLYVLHCGRSVIRPEDIARCLAYTARDFQNMLRLDSVRQDVCSTYADILRELDEPETLLDRVREETDASMGSLSDEDTPSDEDKLEHKLEDKLSDEDTPFDEDKLEDKLSDEDTPSEEYLKAMFKNCVQALFPQLRNAGKDTTEAATLAIELAKRGYDSEKAGHFCESLCPCQLCVRTNERFASWSDWEPETKEEKSIQKAVQHIIDQIQ